MTYIRIRFKKMGGYYHCRLFTTQTEHGTYANCGSILFDEHEWPDIQAKLSQCEFIDDEDPR